MDGEAEQDLAAAEILLNNTTRLPSVIAFHAQQAVEKCLKAILVRHRIYFPKTHDLGKVLALVAECEPATAERLQESTLLTPFGAEGRYPGDAPDLLPGEETRAVQIARHVRDAVNETLKTYLT